MRTERSRRRGRRKANVALSGALLAGLLCGCGVAPPETDLVAETHVGDEAKAIEADRPTERDLVLEDKTERFLIDASNAPRRGARAPLVTIVMFTDFECPFCARVQETLARALRVYGADLALVVRNMPLPFHSNARPAAEAAREVFEQGGDDLFFEYHDRLYANQRSLSRGELEALAAEVGADPAAVGRALDDGRHRALIEADSKEASARGARGTPTFFINGVKLVGAQPYDRFAEIIDRELELARALSKRGVAREEIYARVTKGARTDEGTPRAPSPTVTRRLDPAAVYAVPTEGRPQLGARDALVTVVMFTDLECPFCARAHPTLDALRARHGGRLRWVIRNNPLPFHRNAMTAAEVGLEVHAQRGDAAYFEYVARTYERRAQLSRETLIALAEEVGASAREIESALASGRHRASIEADQELANRLGARGTPAFFVNGKVVIGAQPIDVFDAAVRAGMERAEALVARGVRPAQVYEEIVRAGLREPRWIDTPQPSRPAQPPSDQIYAVDLPERPRVRGHVDAKVTLQVFVDFQCPFSARVQDTLREILARHPSDVRIIHRDLPLPFHPHAALAAEAAREVFAQRGDDAFWQFHDALFEHHREIDRDMILRLAGGIRGVNVARLERALDAGTHRPAVEADADGVKAAGMRLGTPATLVNGRLVSGSQPLESFERAIEAALDEASEPGSQK